MSPQQIPARRSSAVKIDGETWKDLLSVYSGENEDSQAHFRPLSPSPLEGGGMLEPRLDVRKQRQPPPITPNLPASQASGRNRDLLGSLRKLSTGMKDPFKGSIRSSKGSRAFKQRTSLPGLDESAVSGKCKVARAVTVGAVFNADPPGLAPPEAASLRRVTEPHGALEIQRLIDTTAAFAPQRNATVKHVPPKPDGAKSTKIGALFQDLEKLARKKSRAMFHKKETEFQLLRRPSATEGQRFAASSYDGEAPRTRSRTISSTSTVVTMRHSSDSHGTRISSIQEEAPINADFELLKESCPVAAQAQRWEGPQQAPVLGAHVRIMPELDIVEADAQESLWVAVNVVADIGLNDMNHGFSPLVCKPLDVVICIQLS